MKNTPFKFYFSNHGPNPFGANQFAQHGKVSYLYKDMDLKELSAQYPLRKIHGPIPTRNWFVGKTYTRQKAE